MTVSPVDPLFVELQQALVGRYSLERELGRGGMGIVFLAREVALDRLVAIKLLPPALADDPGLKGRFLREARIAARLSHPNIVPIHAVETAGRLVWFVMAFVPGESLGARLRDKGSLPVGDLCRILRDAAWALAHAHGHGVVHRDVKPDNILLESGGRRALLVDFGIAAPTASDGPGDGKVFGTMGYLSPEQARGDAVDGRSDLYALGVVAYHALSGQLPYAAQSLDQLINRQLAGSPPSLAAVAPHVPRALCRTIDRCLAGYPTARFQTGEELAEALEQLQAGPSELPAPLRVWLAQGKARARPAAFISLAWGLPMLVGGVVASMASPFGAGFLVMGAVGAMIMVAPWGLYTAVRVYHTRRLFAAGYSHADIIHALDRYIEQRREELAFEHGIQKTTIGRLTNLSLAGLVVLCLGSMLTATILPAGHAVGAAAAAVAGITAVLGGILFFARNVIPGARAGARDRVAELARWFWKSKTGLILSSMSRWRLKAQSAPNELVHRATEVALGQAAEALYKALPAAHRRDLKRMPEQITYLSAQAATMRTRLEELDDLIAAADPDTLFGSRPGGDGGAAELRNARDLWATQLRDTVAMLESLRLGLLRLHAGSAQPAELTAELDAARLLHERLLLLHDAQAEVSDLLPRPARPEPTPVP
jgi:serine/threonine-protein kinase